MPTTGGGAVWKSRLLLNQPVGRGSGEEGVSGAVAAAAPVAVPAGVNEHGPASNVIGGQRAVADLVAQLD
jgi:threonine/homoserine efflux transporter RhtA